MRLLKKIHSAARRKANFFAGRNSTDEVNGGTKVKQIGNRKKKPFWVFFLN